MMTSIESLGFSRFRLGQSVGEEEIVKILEDGHTRKGGVLDFSGADLSKESAMFIADVITSRSLGSIFTHVDLSSTGIRFEALAALVDCSLTNLRQMTLRNNSLPAEAAKAVTTLLSSEGCLEDLNLSGNKLGDVGVTNISSAFYFDMRIMGDTTQTISLLSLITLDLSSNGLGDVSVLALCRGLLGFARQIANSSLHPNLRVLKLNSNSLGNNAGLCLAQMLQSCHKLANYRVDSEDEKDEGRKHGGGFLQLYELEVNDNLIGEEGLAALILGVQDCQHKSLRSLRMSNNKPTLRVVDQIGKMFSVDTALRVLEMDFPTAAAVKAVRDQKFSTVISNLAKAFHSRGKTSVFTEISLGQLHCVAQQAVLDTQAISFSDREKLEEALDDLQSFGRVIKIAPPVSLLRTGAEIFSTGQSEIHKKTIVPSTPNPFEVEDQFDFIIDTLEEVLMDDNLRPGKDIKIRNTLFEFEA